MKILGVTAEYNPFHNGHEYHLKRAKELTGTDYTVVCMSGNFVQRGEPAFMDKWTRSRIAVRCGADLVVELPFIFACNRAEHFAGGAVDTLVSLGVTHISFGCEAENEEALRRLARKMVVGFKELEPAVAELMKEHGISRAKAHELTVIKMSANKKEAAQNAEIISNPNNILALEYLKRMEFHRAEGRFIADVPVLRYGSGYYDVGKGFAGAAEIRKMDSEDVVAEYVPAATLEEAGDIVSQKKSHDRTREKAFEILRSRILVSSAEELAGIYCVGEGLENRLKREIVPAASMEDLIERMVSKRYTAATIKRILNYIILNVRGCEADSILEGGVQYARVLAAGAGGRELLNRIKKEERAQVPVLTNINREIPKDADDRFRMMLLNDIKSSDMFNLMMERSLYGYSDRVVKPYIQP
ncbi:MAG: nucleotidyltransferase family protein [Lentihominibacter sp.]|jgi:predicted nucleotidyltransferase